MYRIIVRFSHAGLIAYDITGDTLKIAVAKALHFRSQGFHVEIQDAEGNDVALADH
jgi:hypothetical protein